MVNEFREARGFALELLVIVILIMELFRSSAASCRGCRGECYRMFFIFMILE